MSIFGKKSGGGRRAAQREKLPLPAMVSTIENTAIAELLDLSSTGAKLKGLALPPEGEVLSLKLDCVRAFGQIAWRTADECGVHFDVPLAPFELARLRREVSVTSVIWGSVDERLAARDWHTGFAR